MMDNLEINEIRGVGSKKQFIAANMSRFLRKNGREETYEI
jgi:hypothetical protein